jgi:6-phosphogluconolactonase (cycloisomerase 2 family)
MMFAYVGSRTTRERNARGEGLSVFRVSPSGELQRVQLVEGLVNPSYLLLNRRGERLYCVHGDQFAVSAFAVDRPSGRLTLLGTQGTGGKNPVHLTLDRSERFLVVTNHIGACLAVLPLASDGSLLPVQQLVHISGKIGPHRIEQTQAKPHYAGFDPSGRFLLVPDKGLDRVFTFAFDDNGRLGEQPVQEAAVREGAGPRHLVFHPQRPWVYVVNELDSSVTAHQFDAESGALQPFQWLPTLPPDYTGNSRGAGIAVDAAGRFLYASNRGHDSIAVFRIDAETGCLSFEGADGTLGRTPRFFTIAPDGRTMFVLNEDSDSVVAFTLDPENGRPLQPQPPMECGSPVCMVFLSS